MSIDHGVDVSGRNSSGETELAKAVGFGHVATCEVCSNDAPIPTAETAGATDLRLASGYGHTGVHVSLPGLESTSAPKSSWGNTPGHRAAAHGHLPVLEELYRYNADFSRKNKMGRHFLEVAQQENREDAIKFLSSIFTGKT